MSVVHSVYTPCVELVHGRNTCIPFSPPTFPFPIPLPSLRNQMTNAGEDAREKEHFYIQLQGI